MNRDADRIRSDIRRTRASLDQKLSQLEARAREFTPGRVARRVVRERVFEQVVGGALLLTGAVMAWRSRRRRVH